MLIGIKNNVNDKLLQELSQISSFELIDYREILKNPEILNAKYSNIILVNLMDVGGYDQDIVEILRKYFSDIKIIALHCFKSEAMISSVLEKGYDFYISIFDFSEEISEHITEFDEINKKLHS